MNEPLVQVGRLALRHEGENWNAYYVMHEHMDDRIFLGSIRMGAVTDNPTRKQAFMDMMKDIVADFIEKATGIRPIWGGPQSAPEHERSGAA